MNEIEFSKIKKGWENLFVRIGNDEIGSNIVLTIYVPFCGQKCKFCNCFVRKWDENVIENYMNILEIQMNLYKDIFKKHEFDTIIISGGSPATLGKDNLSKLFKLINTNFNIAEEKYIIFEADVHFTNKEVLDTLKNNGVTNITFGIQTINKNILLNMRRFQDEQKITKLVNSVKEHGFGINLDLIYGLYEDNLDSFKKSLEFTYLLDPDQINIYRNSGII